MLSIWLQILKFFKQVIITFFFLFVYFQTIQLAFYDNKHLGRRSFWWMEVIYRFQKWKKYTKRFALFLTLKSFVFENLFLIRLNLENSNIFCKNLYQYLTWYFFWNKVNTSINPTSWILGILSIYNYKFTHFKSF